MHMIVILSYFMGVEGTSEASDTFFNSWALGNISGDKRNIYFEWYLSRNLHGNGYSQEKCCENLVSKDEISPLDWLLALGYISDTMDWNPLSLGISFLQEREIGAATFS